MGNFLFLPGESMKQKEFLSRLFLLLLLIKRKTLFLIEAEGIEGLSSWIFGEEDINEEQLEALGRVDILLVPINGDKTINFKEAEKVIAKIEPKIVIPMAYDSKKKIDS